MLVVGGQRDHGTPEGGIGFLRDGARYDPALRRWRPIPDAPTCPSFGTWTGKELIVGGSCANHVVFAAYDLARNRWTTLPAHASATGLVSAGGRLYAWSAATGRGAIYQPGPKQWRALPAISDAALADSQAVAYRNRLAVVGRESEPMFGGRDVGRAAVLGPRSWTSAVGSEEPPLGGSVVASTDGAVLWSSADAFAAETIDRPMRSFSLVTVGDAPISLDRLGESIVGIGYRRFFVWGGRLAGTEKDPTNRPTADGAIVEVRSLPS
jgi:hypothetical protein